MATLDYEYYVARASLGGLVSESEGRQRPTKVELVVGDDRLDSTRYQSDRRGRAAVPWQRLNFVIEDVPIAMERDLWMATDASYKTAVASKRSPQLVRLPGVRLPRTGVLLPPCAPSLRRPLRLLTASACGHSPGRDRRRCETSVVWTAGRSE
jgi:hypothetical protein